jgi:diaminopimelate epimerase
MAQLAVVKGHGTQNDFVLLPDAEAAYADLLDPVTVAAICDRRAGLGADGLIRVVPTASVAEVADLAAEAEWFMDYRNADGSIAEMCGNGARVFARFLLERGWVAAGGTFAIATRGGVRHVEVHGDDLAIDMGPADFPQHGGPVEVLVDGRAWSATSVTMPNPHAVVFVDDLEQAGSLLEAPDVLPLTAFPDGVNVEFVVTTGPAHVAMRVHERGSGETRSCGTGACAVAVAARRRHAHQHGIPLADAPAQWIVDVPGGRLSVTERGDGHVILAGPAVLVAEASVDLDAVALQR